MPRRGCRPQKHLVGDTSHFPSTEFSSSMVSWFSFAGDVHCVYLKLFPGTPSGPHWEESVAREGSGWANVAVQLSGPIGGDTWRYLYEHTSPCRMWRPWPEVLALPQDSPQSTPEMHSYHRTGCRVRKAMDCLKLGYRNMSYQATPWGQEVSLPLPTMQFVAI